MEKLPPDKTHVLFCKCPWCAADVGAATVTIEALVDAYKAGELSYVRRDKFGVPHDDALTAHCPSCSRPFAIALQEGRGEKYWRFLAVRTAADRAYLCGEAAW